MILNATTHGPAATRNLAVFRPGDGLDLDICPRCDGSGVGVADTTCTLCDGLGGVSLSPHSLARAPHDRSGKLGEGVKVSGRFHDRGDTNDDR